MLDGGVLLLFYRALVKVWLPDIFVGVGLILRHLWTSW